MLLQVSGLCFNMSHTRIDQSRLVISCLFISGASDCCHLWCSFQHFQSSLIIFGTVWTFFLCNVCMSGLVKLFHILLSDRIQICRSLIYSTKASIKTQCYIMQMSNYNSIVLIKNSQPRFNMMTNNMQSFTCFFFLCFKKNTSSQAFQNMLLFNL